MQATKSAWVALHLSILLLCLPGAMVSAQTTQQVDRISEQIKVGKFKGWSKIALICDRGKGAPIEVQICERVVTGARFLAASSKVPLVHMNSFGDLLTDSDYPNVLVLLVELTSVLPGPPSAVYVRVTAIGYPPVRNLVKDASDLWTSRMSLGSLTLWSREALGASATDGRDLVKPISDGAEQLIKLFLTEFLEAN